MMGLEDVFPFWVMAYFLRCELLVFAEGILVVIFMDSYI